jgi:hypothetical protein
MRVLLRSRKTKLYYAGGNQVGLSHEQAFDFGNLPGAAAFAVRENPSGMEIVLRYDTCDGEVAVPILQEWCSGGHAPAAPRVRT